MLSEDTDIEEIQKALYALVCYSVDSKLGRNVQINVALNGQKVVAVADSGAAVSMCGSKDAQRLGLESTGIVRRFGGLGKAEAYQAKPMELKVLGKSLMVSMFVVPQEDLPVLVGGFMRKNTSHLVSSRGDELWQLLLKYKTCWLRPRSGKVKVLKAKFISRRPTDQAKAPNVVPAIKTRTRKTL